MTANRPNRDGVRTV